MRRVRLIAPAISVMLLAILTSCTMSGELLGVTGTPLPTVPVANTEPTITLAPTQASMAMDDILATAVSVQGSDTLEFIFVQHARCDWDSFWCTVEQGIRDAAANLNINVTILGPDEFDLEATASLIDQAVAMAPDGIGLTVTDPGLFAEAIIRANEAGIPLMAYNAGSGPVVDNLPYFSYLGQDEYQSGYLSGLRLAAAGGRAGVCINQAVGSINLDSRCRGFADAFNELGHTVQVLPVAIGEEEAIGQMRDYFDEHPEVDTVLTLGPASAHPYYAYLETAQRAPGDFVHGTFDLNEEIAAAIMAGRTLFGVDQQPYLQGYGVVYWLNLIHRLGIRPVVPTMATGPGFIDADSLISEPNPDAPVRIIAIQHARCDWNAFWCVIENGIRRAANDLGVEVTVLGPDSFDLTEMSTLLDEAIAQGPDAIMMTLPDVDALRDGVLDAADAGIPIVVYNAGNGPLADDLPYLTYLGQDDYSGGYQAAVRLVRAGGTQGVCLNHQVGNASTEERCDGFLDGFGDADLNAEVLAISDDPVFSQGQMETFFGEARDVDAVLTLGPTGSEPYYRFLRSSGRVDLLHGTFDLNSNVVLNVVNGNTLFAIDQQPYLQGYGAVTALTLFIRQGIVPALPVTATGPGFVDSGNVRIVQDLTGIFR